MMLAAAWVLLSQTETSAGEGSLTLALRFLARHQREDGSWGEPPPSCSCRRAIPRAVPERDPADLSRLIRALGSERPEERARASEELRQLGRRALPQLQEAAQDEDPEIRDRCAALRRELERPFAAGAGDVELTGLALLTYLGAGYSHLSKDVHDELCFGTVVKKGILWLLARQRETGAFDLKDPVADTVAALALSECYGMTASVAYKDDVEAAAQRVAARAATDTRGMIWKGMLLKSAELSDLTVDPKAARANLVALQERPVDSLQRAGLGILSIFVEKKKNSPCLEGLHLLDPLRVDLETLYLGTIGTFQFDGPRGPLWSSWKAGYTPYLLPLQVGERCERGSWAGEGFRGRLRATALSAMCFEIYYHY
jgi:hypothetical protein